MNGYDTIPERVDRILPLAKQSARILTDGEIRSGL
jgi:hypothetical protein